MAAPKGNQYAKGNKGGTGQPTKYRAEYVEQARKLCELGATDVELADFFNVAESTVRDWAHRHKAFSDALKVGKAAADDRVERSLYARALGYTKDTVKIFNSNGEPMVVPYREHVPPDTTAAIFWLKNRRRNEWRDKQDVEHSGQVTVEVVRFSDDDEDPAT